MAAALHRHGAVCTVQLTHGGRRERWDDINWLPAFAPSPLRELIHRSFPAEMEAHDFRRICEDYAAGGPPGARRRSRRCRDFNSGRNPHRAILVAGDELPAAMAMAVASPTACASASRSSRACRRVVGDDYIIGIRMPGDERLKGGLTQEDCIEIARTYAASGLDRLHQRRRRHCRRLQGERRNLADHVAALGTLSEACRRHPGRGRDPDPACHPHHRRRDRRPRGEGRALSTWSA